MATRVRNEVVNIPRSLRLRPTGIESLGDERALARSSIEIVAQKATMLTALTQRFARWARNPHGTLT